MRLPGLVFLLAFLLGRAAVAQSYAGATPVPRATGAAQLQALIRDREVEERFRRGLDAESRADWSAAATEFGRAVALDPPEPRGSTAYYDLGIALVRSGDDVRAAAAFSEALRRDPGFAAAAANLVEAELGAGDLTAARAAADRFVAIAPEALRARYARGLVALQQNDLATARGDFSALTAAAPAYAIGYYDLAVVEIRAGRYPQAQAELEQALTLSPGYARARFALATVLLRGNRRAEAIAALGRVEQDAADPTLRALATALRERLSDAER